MLHFDASSAELFELSCFWLKIMFLEQNLMILKRERKLINHAVFEKKRNKLQHLNCEIQTLCTNLFFWHLRVWIRNGAIAHTCLTCTKVLFSPFFLLQRSPLELLICIFTTNFAEIHESHLFWHKTSHSYCPCISLFFPPSSSFFIRILYLFCIVCHETPGKYLIIPHTTGLRECCCDKFRTTQTF